MKWVLIMIFSIAVIFIVLLFSSIEFRIRYIFKFNENNDITININYLFNLIKKEIKPFKKSKISSQKINKDKYKTNLLSKNNFDEYKDLFLYILSKIEIEKFSWKTKIGYIDAYYLSMIYGAIWWIKSIITGTLVSYKKIESLNIDVVPIYNTNQLDISFDCIIKIRMVYIINIWIKLLKLYKGGEKVDCSSNRRFNANYNE